MIYTDNMSIAAEYNPDDYKDDKKSTEIRLPCKTLSVNAYKQYRHTLGMDASSVDRMVAVMSGSDLGVTISDAGAYSRIIDDQEMHVKY